MPKVLPSAPTPGGGRLARSRRVSTTLAEINVIPLVDVMLVLLIIFMVAAPMLQRGVEVNLPVASRSQEIASDQQSALQDRADGIEEQMLAIAGDSEILTARAEELASEAKNLAGRANKEFFDKRMDKMEKDFQIHKAKKDEEEAESEKKKSDKDSFKNKKK